MRVCVCVLVCVLCVCVRVCVACVKEGPAHPPRVVVASSPPPLPIVSVPLRFGATLLDEKKGVCVCVLCVVCVCVFLFLSLCVCVC